MKLIDLTGRTFGRWLVLGRDGALWRCACACREVRTVAGGKLRSGRSLSCGCLRREIMRARVSPALTHGMWRSPEWRAWTAMRGRCSKPRHPLYPDYGGRGIAVCERWQSFEAFYADMGPRPAGMSIDRRDNEGDYTPSNCRWATRVQQARNKRNNVRVEVRGERVLLVELAERTGVRVSVLRGRVRRGAAIEGEFIE